jgi:uncharacterized protein with HEPN domain
MTAHNDKDYINHILEAIDKIFRYVGDMSYENFSKNDMAIDAVAREFTIIGEAANNLSLDFKEKHSNIPWHLPVGMRNQLMHGYFSVDLDVIWNTLKQDLPSFKKLIEKI